MGLHLNSIFLIIYFLSFKFGECVCVCVCVCVYIHKYACVQRKLVNFFGFYEWSESQIA